MQSLSIWQWIIIAILIGLGMCAIGLFARAINNRRPKERSVKESGTATPVTGPSGFGGWLVLLAFGVFVQPIFTIVALSQLEDGVDDDAIQRFHLLFDTEFALYLAVLSLQICTAFLLRVGYGALCLFI